MRCSGRRGEQQRGWHGRPRVWKPSRHGQQERRRGGNVTVRAVTRDRRGQASTNPGRPSSLWVLTVCPRPSLVGTPWRRGRGTGRGGDADGSLRPHGLLGRVRADEAGGLLGRVPLTECRVLLPGSISCDCHRQGQSVGPPAAGPGHLPPAGPAVGRGRGQVPCVPPSLADRITHTHPRLHDSTGRSPWLRHVAISTNYCHRMTIVCLPTDPPAVQLSDSHV